jgi:hypothetical protein
MRFPYARNPEWWLLKEPSDRPWYHTPLVDRNGWM